MLESNKRHKGTYIIETTCIQIDLLISETNECLTTFDVPMSINEQSSKPFGFRNDIRQCLCCDPLSPVTGGLSGCLFGKEHTFALFSSSYWMSGLITYH